MELAIINGTYRDGTKMQQKINQILIPNHHHNNAALAAAAHAAAAAAAAAHIANPNLRSPPNPLGQPLIISPRLAAAAAAAAAGNQANNSQQHQQTANFLNGATAAQLIAAASSGDHGLIYAHIPGLYQDPTNGAFNAAAAAAMAAAGSPTLLEYPGSIDFSQAGKCLVLL
jgi:hypothetical protein